MRREKCLVNKKTAAHEIPNVRVLPLGAVVTHKVRVINDLSFVLFNRAKKGGLNAETDVNSVPRACAGSGTQTYIYIYIFVRARGESCRSLFTRWYM